MYREHLLIIGGFVVAAVLLTVSLVVIFMPKTDTTPVTLKFWGYWDPAVVEPLFQEYHDTHPLITIEYEKREQESYRETLQTRLANGSGPDMFFYPSKWLPVLMNQLSPMPKGIYEESSFKDSFFPISFKDLNANSKLWGVPVSYEGLGLLYNYEQFRPKGLDHAPATWDDLRTTYYPLLQVNSKEGEIQTATIPLGTSNNVDYASQILQLMMAQNGVTFITKGQLSLHTSLSADQPPRNLGADALTFYSLFAQGNKDQVFWNSSLPSSTEAFTSGKVAMLLAPNTTINDILKNSQDQHSSLDLKVSAVPQIPDKKPLTWGTSVAVGVSSYSTRQEKAWEFLKFFSSQKAEASILSGEQKLMTVPHIPARVGVAASLQNNPYLGAYVTQAPYAVNFYGGDNSSDSVVNEPISAIFHDMIDNPSRPENIIAKDGLKIEALLSQYGIVQAAPAPSK